MRLNVRTKLVAIVGASAAAFVVLIVTGAMLASSVTQRPAWSGGQCWTRTWVLNSTA